MNDLIIPAECLAMMLCWAGGFVVVLVVLSRRKQKIEE